MMVKHKCIPLDSPGEWNDALTGIKHSFAHTWESCHAMHLTTGFRTYLYTFEADSARVVCPISEREFEGYTDVVTPYGLSGFVGNGDCSRFPHCWKQFAIEKQYVCGYLGLNPLVENSTYVNQQDVHRYNKIYVLDLTISMDSLFIGLPKKRQRQLRQWPELRKHLAIGEDASKKFFVDRYLDFMRTRHAAEVYGFSAKTLSLLLELKNVFIVSAQGPNGLEAVSVFAHTPYAAEYLFNVSVPAGRHHSVALIWYAIFYLKELNIPWLNLGGGIIENDGVARFKQRFGAKEFSLGCVKQVYECETFAKLCHRTGTDPQDRTGYFPPYRKLQGVSSRVH